MRFEVIAAIAVGGLLPILETVRRGWSYWTVNATTMLEDYVAGALLLAAGWAARRRKRFAPRLLLTAWGCVAGMMSSSFFSQLEAAIRGDEFEPNHGMVLVVKLLLWATCITALVLSFRRAIDVGMAGVEA
jgi:hypothetical protein